MSQPNGYIYGPPPAPPPKATGPSPPYSNSQNSQFPRGGYGGNRGRGNNRGGGRGNFNNRGGGGGSNHSQGRGGYTNFGSHPPPHGSPSQPPFPVPVAASYPPLPNPSYPPPAHQPAPVYSPPIPSSSSFQSRPPHQTSQYQPPPQAFGHQPPQQQPRPSFPQASTYGSPQANPYSQPNRWPQPSPVPPPPQHQPPTSTPQPIRFFPQQPPPPSNYHTPQPPPHPAPPTTGYQPGQPYGSKPPVTPQPHSAFQNQGARPHHSYADLRVDGRVRPPAPPSVPTFFGSSLPQPPPSLPPHPPPPSPFNQHGSNQQRHNQHHGQHHNQHHNQHQNQHQNQHHGQQQQHHGQHNRNRGNFGNRNNNGFNHDRRNKDKGHRNHHQNQQFQMPQNSDIDMSPEEYAIWQASGGKIKGTNLTLKDPAEQEKWLEDRRKKWPTAARVAARKADEEEKQRAEQHDALQKKLESLDKTESQLRKRKLDEVDEEDKAKQPSKKKKKKKKKKRPQDDAPVAFEEQPTAANAEVTASEIPADDITVEEPADAPTEDVKETKSEVVVDEYEEPSLAADFDDFLLAEEMAESAGVQQVDLVTESPPNGQDQSAALLDLEQADVTVEEPQCPAPGENQSPTVEDEEGEESVAMSTSSTTGESAAESAEESGNGSDNGSDDGSDESDADAPPDEASTKPTGLPEKPPTAAANKKKQVCKLWLRKNCKYGAKCKYLHEGGVPKSDKERREEKKQQKDTSQKEMSLYDKLMQAQMEKENVKLLQAINFFVEKGILKA